MNITDEESRAVAESTLNTLFGYENFLESVDTFCDMGCGDGDDLERWATAAILDDNDRRIPLNIDCTGIDKKHKNLSLAQKYKNVTYKRADFENLEHKKDKLYDVVWCHNAFHYALNPYNTLAEWNRVMSDGGMLIIQVPTSVEMMNNQMHITLQSNTFYHYTTVSLMYMLALSGFECAFMQKRPEERWLKAITYKVSSPQDPRNTSWYDLLETDLLPDSAKDSINRFGYLRHQDLILSWLDGSKIWHGFD